MTPELTPEIKAEAARQFDIIARGCSEIISPEDLRRKLETSILHKRPLRVKFGADPTAPDLHLGHVVVLKKLKDFQDLGHQVLFLIGDFTAQIGDPTGKSETRKPLSREEVNKNAKTYADQILKILHPSKTSIVFNSQWTDPLKIQDTIRLMSQVTVARLIERDDFAKRYKEGHAIGFHELMYPVLQAFDSVQLRSDIELGGTDQRFNLLMGRDLQKNADQEPQVVVMTPLLEGTDGVNKMSKSLGNSIGITEEPKDMFGKIMRISDPLMMKFYELLTNVSIDEVKAMHPKEAKMRLAFEMVERFYNTETAQKAGEEFDAIFTRKELPTEIPTATLTVDSIALTKLLVENELATSVSEARRLIAQGGVYVDGTRIEDTAFSVEGKSEALIKVGKRKFLQVKFIKNLKA